MGDPLHYRSRWNNVQRIRIICVNCKANREDIEIYPPFLTNDGATMNNKILITREEKLRSLLADEAKNANMMMVMLNTLRQMQAKSTFRLALLNQLLEEELDENN